jgi:hypothetical protein
MKLKPVKHFGIIRSYMYVLWRLEIEAARTTLSDKKKGKKLITVCFYNLFLKVYILYACT